MNLFTRLTNIGIKSDLTRHNTKTVRLLNIICITWYIVILLFLITNFLFNQKYFLVTSSTHIVQFLILMSIQYLQYKGKYKVAQFIFISSGFLYFFTLSNFLVKGQQIEFFYILIPIFSLLFLNKNIYHYFFLVVAIFCFSVVPEFFHVYPATRTSSAISMPNLFIMIFLMFKYFKDENTKNELILEEDREQIEKDKIKIEQQAYELKELNEFQTHFFINITHELRTPLTLIKGNVFGAKKTNALNEIQEKLDKILIHSNKIENLINDIIDVSKAETNTLSLNWESHAINPIIQKQYLTFRPLFEEQGINFEYALPEKNVYVEIDKLYFERVIGNILVNAAKYTPKGGHVAIFITNTDDQISIHIKDNGIGIALGEEEKIFNRFYQINNDINNASGSGLGLAFCTEVIQLLKGDIKALQNEDEGATFSITLPKNHVNGVDILPKPDINIDSEKPTLLLVEDNTDMREYLSSILTDYNLIEARNGEEALEILKDNSVDALITDYMMPKMDGYELIKQIKERKYSFPILVITARADIKSKLDVLALGIDDYLTKPFIEEELLYRLRHSLLNSKNRSNYRKEESALLQKEESTIPESDLIKKSRLVVEENIDNPLFGVPDLVEALDLTERTLYRKIKANSGLTPNQFIREIKLLHVRSLIEQNKSISLNELTEKVGFKNTTHLQKIYKKRFGTSLSI